MSEQYKIRTFRKRSTWLAARRSYICASDSPAILGAGYADQGALGVYLDKVEEADPDADLSDEKRQRFERGQVAEEFVLRLFSMETGVPAKRMGTRLCVSTDEQTPWLASTLDALTDDGNAEPVEAKFVGRWMMDEWGDGQTPLKHQIQLQHQMATIGTEAGWLVGWDGSSNPPMVRRCERNQEFIDAMLAALTVFWGRVQDREPPFDQWERYATSKALEKLHPKDNGGIVLLPESLRPWCEVLAESVERKKRLEAVITEAQNRIKAEIGDNAYGALDEKHVYSWLSQHRDAYEVQAADFRAFRKARCTKAIRNELNAAETEVIENRPDLRIAE